MSAVSELKKSGEKNKFTNNPAYPAYPTETATEGDSSQHQPYTDPAPTQHSDNNPGESKGDDKPKSGGKFKSGRKSKGGGKSAAESTAKLVGQNNLADEITPTVTKTLIFDPVSQRWHKKQSNIWQPVDDSVARIRVSTELKTVKPSFAYGYLSGVTGFIKDSATIDGWTESSDTLPMLNGVFSISEKKLRDYAGTDYYNWQLPYTHTKNTAYPNIEKALKQWSGDRDDMLQFMLCWLYCVLTRRSRIQKYLELIGPGGTGKSSFMNLCTMLVGEQNRVVTELKQLEKNQFETAALYGKSLVLITDSERFGGEVAQLKKITGGDPLRNEVKHRQQAKPFVYQGMVMIAANEPIQSSDYTSGLSRRRITLPFDNVLTDKQKTEFENDGGIADKFRKEIPALINALLKMNPESVDATINKPGDTVAKNTLKNGLETNPMLAWANKRLVTCNCREETCIGLVNSPPDKYLYPNYLEWCENRSQSPVSHVRFSELLADRLIAEGIKTKKDRNSKGNFITNYRLRRITDKHDTLFTGEKWNEIEG